MEKLGKETETFEVMAQLEHIIAGKYSEKSVEMGLHLIDKGRKKGSFAHFEEALQFMQRGMNLLIEVRYRDHCRIGKMYMEMAVFNRQLKNLDSEYSSLICAHSMMRQLPNKEKELL